MGTIDTTTTADTSDSIVSSIIFQSPVRSGTSNTIADSTINTQELQDCHDEDCAFKWMTYVADYTCPTSDAPQKTMWSRVSIHELLHRDADNSFCKKIVTGQVRHVHLPANNMKWVEDLILRYYHGQDRASECKILQSNYWYGQQHGIRFDQQREKGSPIHARFMRPRCDLMLPGEKIHDTLHPKSQPLERGDSRKGKSKKDKPKKTYPKATHRDFVICMPYLHCELDDCGARSYIQADTWEFDEARDKMQEVINDMTSENHKCLPRESVAHEDEVYGHDGDEQLLRKHLLEPRPVHIRRTLDQSYYWTLKDTKKRDRDQVVYRWTKKDEHSTEPQLVMVDQLWLWILDGSVVVSSFPRRWGRKKSDASGIYRIVRDRLNAKPDLDNVYDMATLIMDQCSRFFFDRMVPKDERPQVIDIFANAIGDITDKSIVAYTRFWESIDSKAASHKPNSKEDQETINTQRNEEEREHDEDLLDELLDINPEGALLKEIKDILDELHMMMKVFNEQSNVIEDFSSHIQKLEGSNKYFPASTREKTAKLVNDVSRRKAEVHELTQAAKRTADGLKELLDLKQKHANIYVARSAVSRTEESNDILEATKKLAVESTQILKATQDLATESAEQTKQGAAQNRSLLIFTIVTIVFLPLGFFSSVFGMNAVEFGQGKFHIWWQIMIMVLASTLIIIFSLYLALNEHFWLFFVELFVRNGRGIVDLHRPSNGSLA